MKDQDSCRVGMVAKITVLQIKQDSSLKLSCQIKACLKYR